MPRPMYFCVGAYKIQVEARLGISQVSPLGWIGQSLPFMVILFVLCIILVFSIQALPYVDVDVRARRILSVHLIS